MSRAPDPTPPKRRGSKLDRHLGQLRRHGPRFFSGGFGSSALLEQLQGRAHGIGIPELGAVRLIRQPEAGLHETWRGVVESPATLGPLPDVVRTLHFTLRLPANAKPGRTPMAVVVELVPLLGSLPTRLLTTRLVGEGVGSVVLEAPWHGARIADAPGPGVTHTVEDFVLMQRAAALEACALAAWLLAQGHPRVVLTGYGLGGALAAHAASVFPIPLAAAPLLAPESAAPVFFDGVLRSAADLPALIREAGSEASARHRLERALGGIALTSIEERRPAALFAARRDGWIPAASTLRLAQQLAGAPVRTFPGGHVEAALRGTSAALATVEQALGQLPELALNVE